jgi:hypothetical protein
MELLIIAMETQEWIPFSLLSSYKIFRAAARNIKVLKSSCKLPHFWSCLNEIRIL